jgi:hypothetical protein
MFIFVVEGQSFVTGDAWSQRDKRRTFMGFNSLSNVIAGLCSSYFVVEENEWAT